MRQSKLAIKTQKENPKDADNISAALLIRGGFIDKVASGIYSYLPLGLKVLRKIENIIREEMNAIDGQEILMPALEPKENWEVTGRWNNFDALIKIKAFGDKEFTLGSTHEEIITPLAKKIISSYKDLPIYLYQIQTKFRNEARAKSGLLRGREFGMKDLYSFHTDEEDLDRYYSRAVSAYYKVFDRFGIGDETYLTYASGGAFSKYSHEFQTVCEAGEDTVFVCANCKVAVNKEIIEEQSICPKCGNKELIEKKSVEVGNIFKLGTKYSKPFDLIYLDEKGERKDVIMGCYGMGTGRNMGTIVELFHDENGIIWPESVSPFDIHLIVLGETDEVKNKAEEVYQQLLNKGFDVLFDDREESAGVKFADADLIGITKRVIVSGKTLAAGGVGYRLRAEKEEAIISMEELMSKL
ncbi:MAG TPA: His/Gly/Thr/Pro-type tRNA ligase C-terminal domain-containing protein [Patescibacteria group bacterium]|nr:His/Gly/Thr/Pro-type tRNA ligase C-terminal domain-containing protein [Patescibacteria group bacterium]